MPLWLSLSGRWRANWACDSCRAHHLREYHQRFLSFQNVPATFGIFHSQSSEQYPGSHHKSFIKLKLLHMMAHQAGHPLDSPVRLWLRRLAQSHQVHLHPKVPEQVLTKSIWGRFFEMGLLHQKFPRHSAHGVEGVIRVRMGGALRFIFR